MVEELAALHDNQRRNVAMVPKSTALSQKRIQSSGLNYGRGYLSWEGADSTGNQAENPARIPRFSSSVLAGPSGGAVS
jgi:hypothetical protein